MINNHLDDATHYTKPFPLLVLESGMDSVGTAAAIASVHASKMPIVLVVGTGIQFAQTDGKSFDIGNITEMLYESTPPKSYIDLLLPSFQEIDCTVEETKGKFYLL